MGQRNEIIKYTDPTNQSHEVNFEHHITIWFQEHPNIHDIKLYKHATIDFVFCKKNTNFNARKY